MKNLDIEEEAHGSLLSYIIGFLICLVLTLASFILVSEHMLQGWQLIAAIFGLGIVQVFVQLVFFLHLGNESKPYWYLMTFLFMALVLVIIVWGSLWIMYSLEDRVMHIGMSRHD